jgi:hypothetical protein
MFYSKSTGGFYTPELHPEMPDDAVEVDDSEYTALMQAQEKGQVIIGNLAGRPIAVDAWQAMSLEQARADKLAELAALCAAEITAGIESGALGEKHIYPSLQTDQANLTASVVASILPGVDDKWVTPILCRNPAGLWAYRDHTARQVQQVGNDMKNVILTARVKRAKLADVAMTASSIAALRAIKW